MKHVIAETEFDRIDLAQYGLVAPFGRDVDRRRSKVSATITILVGLISAFLPGEWPHPIGDAPTLPRDLKPTTTDFVVPVFDTGSLASPVPAECGKGEGGLPKTGPVPAGSPALWITPDDYPAPALRASLGGLTSVMLTVDTGGSVTGCLLDRPSGVAALDSATCGLLRARARFTPARDAQDCPVPGTYHQRVRWQIPAY